MNWLLSAALFRFQLAVGGFHILFILLILSKKDPSRPLRPSRENFPFRFQALFYQIPQ